MPELANTSEQIINRLRKAEIMLSHGTSMAVNCKKIGVTNQTYNGKLRDELLNRNIFTTLKKRGH